MKTTTKKGACLARLQETCALIGLCFRNFGEFLTLKSEFSRRVRCLPDIKR